MHRSDEEIIELLAAGDQRAVSSIFDQYYDYLCGVVYRVVADYEVSRDIVQDIFVDLWRKQDVINIQTSLRAYLRRAAINRALNHIRKNKITFESDEQELIEVRDYSISGQQDMERSELEKCINAALEKLPPKCKVVFSLSRFEELSYQEIATTLDISIKTVENQISKALRIMRHELAQYLE